MKTVQIDNNMIRMSRIGFGTIPLIGMSPSQSAELLVHAYDKGITLWEGSHDYGTYLHMATALKSLRRDQITIVTKTYANSDAETDADVQDCLRVIQTDYIDVLLLHYSRPEWLGNPPRLPDSIKRQKQEGRVRHVGIATHSVLCVNCSAGMADVDIVEAIISKGGRFRSHKDGSTGSVEDGSIEEMYSALAKAHAVGKYIIGMKVLGNGFHSGTAAKEIQAAVQLPFVDILCIGMNESSQIDQNVKAAENC